MSVISKWALVEINRNQTGTTLTVRPELGKIMNVLEQGLMSGVAMEDVEQNPVFSQMGQNERSKSENVRIARLLPLISSALISPKKHRKGR
jgi:hypothetical protein